MLEYSGGECFKSTDLRGGHDAGPAATRLKGLPQLSVEKSCGQWGGQGRSPRPFLPGQLGLSNLIVFRSSAGRRQIKRLRSTGALPIVGSPRPKSPLLPRPNVRLQVASGCGGRDRTRCGPILSRRGSRRERRNGRRSRHSPSCRTLPRPWRRPAAAGPRSCPTLRPARCSGIAWPGRRCGSVYRRLRIGENAGEATPLAKSSPDTPTGRRASAEAQLGDRLPMA